MRQYCMIRTLFVLGEVDKDAALARRPAAMDCY